MSSGVAASASVNQAAFKAAFVTPAATCGRATKAASPSSATRPVTIRGESRSKIGWKNGAGVASVSATYCGARTARTSVLNAAITSGRISGGGISPVLRPPPPRRQNRTPLRPKRGYHFRTDQRRWNSAVVAPAARIGTEGFQLGRTHRMIPDPVQAPPSGAEIVIGTRLPIGEHHFARCQKEGKGVDQVTAPGRSDRVFIDHATPGHVARITRRRASEDARAPRGMRATGTDQKIPFHLYAIGEKRGAAARILGNVLELHTQPVARVRQTPPQRSVEQRPGGQSFLEWQPRDHGAVAVKADTRRELDADALIDGDAEPAHDLKLLDMRPDADAAACEIAAAAREPRDVPHRAPSAA